MPNSHDLAGIMKFMGRDSWRSEFEEVMTNHFGAALAATDLEFEDLADVLDPHWQMILWGCAFEDALSSDFGDGRNPVDDYLKRRGYREGTQTKAYLKALRSSVMSLYEVSEIVPGQSFLARDLLRGGESVLVSEVSATKSLRSWEKIAGRLVDMNGRTVLAGGVLPFSLQAAEILMEGMAKAVGKKPTLAKPLRLDDDQLRPLAPLFTITWLMDTLQKAMMTDLPEMRNRDGDLIMFHNVRFPIGKGVEPADIEKTLSRIAELEQASETFWNWLGSSKSGRGKKSKGDVDAAPGEVLNLDVTMDDGVPVLGNVELKGWALHLMVNSAERAETGIALLRETLGDKVGPPLTSIRTIEQMMEDRGDQPAQDGPGVPPEIATPLVHDILDRQYRAILDEPLSMIGGKSPRAAAKTKTGRKRVAEWLKYLEYQSQRVGDANDPMATYDYGWLWKELEVEDLRR